MFPRSFRARISLLSLLLSGSVLLIAGLAFLRVAHNVGLERIDQEIRSFAEGRLVGRQPPDFWENVDVSLRFIYGNEQSGRIVLKVRDAEGNILYTSKDWPDAPALDPLPELAIDPDAPRTERKLPPIPGDRPERRPHPPERFPLHDLRPELQLPSMKKPVFLNVSHQGTSWRVGVLGNDDMTVAVGINLRAFQAETDRYWRAVLLAAPLALLALAAASWYLAQRALQPVTSITHTAKQITAKGLDKRITHSHANTEFAQLIDVINDMLSRLEQSFAQAARFSADAAHELQTPLTILQGELEQAVQSSAASSEEQQRYSGLLEEVQRLKSIVQKLLLLARTDAGGLPLQRAPLDFSTAVSETADDVEAMAPTLTVTLDIQPGVEINADADMLQRVLQNLATNAIKYNIENGSVHFILVADAGQARCTVVNTGPALSAEDSAHIFDRFYRAEKSRSRAVEGSGLGLSLAREIARAHDGDIVAESRPDGTNAFVLTLPLA